MLGSEDCWLGFDDGFDDGPADLGLEGDKLGSGEGRMLGLEER